MPIACPARCFAQSYYQDLLLMLHHVEIYVSNLEQSRAFWAWLLTRLDYTQSATWEQGFSFKKGDTYLTFVQVEAKYLDISYHRCRVGLNHLAFAVPTRPEVDDFHRALVEKQIPLLYEEKYPFAGGEDYYAVFFEDPDRMKVEVASLV
jgi:catechol 2,3-dioxygenase-like lactoylglutathione lyase family enzyme